VIDTISVLSSASWSLSVEFEHPKMKREEARIEANFFMVFGF